jgi:hypothetical protein
MSASGGDNVTVDSGSGLCGDDRQAICLTLIEGGVMTADVDLLRQAARKMLSGVLSCRENRSQSGPFVHIDIETICASLRLPNMATEESLSCLSRGALETVARVEGVNIAPRAKDNLVRTFGLEPVDYDGIRDATGEHIAAAAKAFGTALNEKALQIHLQRITGAFVSSAFGAAQFYGTKKSAAMELTSKLLNDDRDEDRDGPAGFESKAERARLFAAEMALQSFALMAAAEGAIAAYADITGENWKPYEAPMAPAATVARKSAAVEMAAFQAA